MSVKPGDNIIVEIIMFKLTFALQDTLHVGWFKNPVFSWVPYTEHKAHQTSESSQVLNIYDIFNMCNLWCHLIMLLYYIINSII